MNIWFVQTGEDIPYRNDIRKLRTAVLADELASRGHQVTWWAASFSHLRKDWIMRGENSCDLDSGVHVELLHGRGYKSNVSLARVIDHRLVARQFKLRSRRCSPPDIVVCSLPPYDLAYQALIYSSRVGIPAVVDVRDTWPDVFLAISPTFLRPLAKLFLQSEFRLTRQALRRATAITAVSEDMLAWALSYCKRKRTRNDRVFYLGFRHEPVKRNVLPAWLEVLRDRFVVAFVGTFSHFHNPNILVTVAKNLLAAGRNDIAIVLAGAGGDLYESTASAAKNIPNITLTGWLEQDGINALLDRSAVGVCPTGAEARLFPNKTFLYFSRGLPVLSAFEGELRKVLDEDGLGRYFRYDDASALTAHIVELCDNKRLYHETCSRV